MERKKLKRKPKRHILNVRLVELQMESTGEPDFSKHPGSLKKRKKYSVRLEGSDHYYARTICFRRSPIMLTKDAAVLLKIELDKLYLGTFKIEKK